MTAMSKAAILRGMREAVEGQKRHDAARRSRAAALSARARLDALTATTAAQRSNAVAVVAPDPLAERAARIRRRAPFARDIEREAHRLRADVLAAVDDSTESIDFSWSIHA